MFLTVDNGLVTDFRRWADLVKARDYDEGQIVHCGFSRGPLAMPETGPS